MIDKAQIKILVVDDEPGIRITLQGILEDEGYEVVVAGLGKDAVEEAGKKFYNVVIADIKLPDISGLEVLQQVLAINEDTMVIMATAFASVETSIDAMNKGAYTYIPKPVNMDEVLIVIERALEKQQLSIENKRLIEALVIANMKFKEFDERKSAFVANVSHEFKNPLAIAQQTIAIVLEDEKSEMNQDQKRMLGFTKASVDRLLRLVEDMLDISKIEAGRMKVNCEKIEVAPLWGEIVELYRMNISEKGISLKEDIQGDAGFFWGDRDKIIEVIINILDNAIKYTSKKGTIGVKVVGTDKEVRFEISDDGPGISGDYTTKIFDKFERVDAESHEGTGLGLPIAKDIVGLHKGRIWVESASGKGSTFIFILPRDSRKA